MSGKRIGEERRHDGRQQNVDEKSLNWMQTTRKDALDTSVFDPYEMAPAEAFEFEFPFLETRFNLNELPSLPAIILRLDYLMEQNRPSIKEVIRTVLTDPTLALRVLSILTLTPSYNPQNPLTVSRVVNFRGLRPIKKLFEGATIFSQNNALEQQSSFSLYTFWKHSVFSAIAAEIIANERKQENIEEALMAGLLHDIGKLVLAQFSPNLFKKYAKMKREHEESLHLEERIFKVTHTEVGRQVGEKLRLPNTIVEVIKYHHFELLPNKNILLINPLIKIVYVAQSIAKLFYLRDQSAHYFYEGLDRAKEYLDFTNQEYKNVVRQVSNRIYGLMDDMHLSFEVFQNYGQKLEDVCAIAEELKLKIEEATRRLKNLEMKDIILDELFPQLIGKASRESLLKNLAATIHVHGNIQHVVLFLYDKTKKLLQSKLNFGLPTNDNLRWAKLELDMPGVIATAFHKKKSLCIRHYNETLKEEGLFDHQELRYVKTHPFVAIPIYNSTESIGVLYLSQGSPNEIIPEDQMKVFEKICQYVGRAIDYHS
ncbi:MAG: HDOD domain-containing protein [candidate division KSB1 bacterium]|nr:HDOD domain-containing protein [candidate division KSB1 bacterium]